MAHTHKSQGAHGPWYLDDDQVTMDGPWTGDLVGDTGIVSLDGVSAVGDTVNVYENANKIATGPVLSGVQYK